MWKGPSHSIIFSILCQFGRRETQYIIVSVWKKYLQSLLTAYFEDLFVPYTHVLFALNADGKSDRKVPTDILADKN